MDHDRGDLTDGEVVACLCSFVVLLVMLGTLTSGLTQRHIIDACSVKREREREREGGFRSGDPVEVFFFA